MPPNAAQLRDIRGLDPIPWWPPGPGWWVAALAILAVAGLLAWLEYRRRYPLMGWKRDAQRRLRALRRRAQNQSVKQTAGELSELIRRIGMARSSREACAGLAGDSWLEWLAHNDPTGYDWRVRGRPLLDLPYAPANYPAPPEAISELIDAALCWVAATEEQARPVSRPPMFRRLLRV
jgi:hypothetical protein